MSKTAFRFRRVTVGLVNLYFRGTGGGSMVAVTPKSLRYNANAMDKSLEKISEK